MTTTTVDRVATAPALDRELLSALVTGELVAIQIPDWFSPERCGEVVARVLAHPQLSPFDGESIRHVGLSTAVRDASAEGAARYRAGGLAQRQLIRELFAPWLSPADRLRLELAECWPSGTRPKYVGGALVDGGEVRIMEEGVGHYLHCDLTDPNDDEPCRARYFSSVVIEAPAAGGELLLWDDVGTDEANDMAFAVQERLGIAAMLEQAPPPTWEFPPHPGELIIAHAARLHAVRPVRSGRRIVALASFNFSGPDRPLIVT